MSSAFMMDPGHVLYIGPDCPGLHYIPGRGPMKFCNFQGFSGEPPTMDNLLLAILAWQYYYFLVCAPSSGVVRGYTLPFPALRSRQRIFFPSILTARLNNGELPFSAIYGKEYVKRIKYDEPKLEAFIYAAENKKQILEEQGKAAESKEVGKLVCSAKGYLTAFRKAIEFDTYFEGLFKTLPTEFLQQQVDNIKDDREELEYFIKHAEMHFRIMLVEGKNGMRSMDRDYCLCQEFFVHSDWFCTFGQSSVRRCEINLYRSLF